MQLGHACYDPVITTTTPDRIVELWPHLSEPARARLIGIAESVANAGDGFEFTPEELAGIACGRDDFKNGRSLTLDEYRADMASFFSRLEAKARSRS